MDSRGGTSDKRPNGTVSVTPDNDELFQLTRAGCCRFGLRLISFRVFQNRTLAKEFLISAGPEIKHVSPYKEAQGGRSYRSSLQLRV